MSVSLPSHKKASIALQRNQEAGIASHLQSGARAELIDSPVTKVLATRRGLILARAMKFLFRGNIKKLLQYAAIRPYAIMEAIRIALGTNPEGKIVLDAATGYSPEFYWLAEEFPETSFIEIDQHEVIEYKRAAYYPIGIPQNLRMKAVDLQTQELHQAQTKAVDVLLTMGAYVSHSDFRELMQYLCQIIRDRGHLVVSFPYAPGIENFTDNSFIFSNLVTEPKGTVETIAELESLFENSAFSIQQIIQLSDYAKQSGRPEPADIEVVVIAQRN